MRKRDHKYLKRLTRFYDLAFKRGMRWTVKHINRETSNAQRVYRVVMGKRVGKKPAIVGLVGTLCLLEHGWQLSNEELSA